MFLDYQLHFACITLSVARPEVERSHDTLWSCSSRTNQNITFSLAFPENTSWRSFEVKVIELTRFADITTHLSNSPRRATLDFLLQKVDLSNII